AKAMMTRYGNVAAENSIGHLFAYGQCVGKVLVRGIVALACSGVLAANPDRFDPKHLTPDQRRAAIRKAAVWTATEVESMNLLEGPGGPGAFRPDETVTCKWVDRKLGG